MFKCEANGLGEDCYAMPYIKMILDKNGRDLAERNFDFHLLKFLIFLLHGFKCSNARQMDWVKTAMPCHT